MLTHHVGSWKGEGPAENGRAFVLRFECLCYEIRLSQATSTESFA